MYKLAQTFNVDAAAVRNAKNIALTSIDLYFKRKPSRTNNKSGITDPGVLIKVCEVTNGLPDLNKVISGSTVSKDYDEIVASTTAQVATNFKFSKAIVVGTNKRYAIVASYDGDEDYELWTCKAGQYLVGTNTKTSGATAKNVDSYFEYSSSTVINPTSATGAATATPSNWKALTDTDLKFTVFCGVFGANLDSTSVANTYVMESSNSEFVVYDEYHSSTQNVANAVTGEMVYQETPVIYGTISVNRLSTTITAIGNVNFSTLFTSNASKLSIVLRDPNSTNVDIREVVDVFSNTKILVDRRPSFTSNAATFSVCPVAQLHVHTDHLYHGSWWDYDANSLGLFSGVFKKMLALKYSRANASVRFVNNMVETVTVSAGGTGYANSDYVIISCSGITGQLNAAANVTTNSTGGITSLTFSNAGWGFTNSIAVAVKNANGVNSSGTGFSANVRVGSTIRTEQSNAQFSNLVFFNLEAHRVLPVQKTMSDSDHTISWLWHAGHYIDPLDPHTVLVANVASRMPIVQFTHNPITFEENDGRIHTIPSKSNYVNANQVVINTAVGSTKTVNSSAVVEANVFSNNIFSVPKIEKPDVYVYQLLVNNDYTNEHKHQGNAHSKYVSKKIRITEDQVAEDGLVYVRAYRPPNTSIVVYARVQNDADAEAFDDKDWTLLKMTSNNDGSYSKLNKKDDIIEFSYGFNQYPNTYSTLAGSAYTELGNTAILGTGTTFSSNLQSSDLIKIYDPLFPNNYMVAVVDTVTNSSYMTISEPVANAGVVGYNKVIDFLGRPATDTTDEIGYPLQAFNNVLNDNVVRYHTQSMSPFDGYHTMAIKVVLLSENRNLAPEVEDVRFIGTST